ncbi:hypothetical protein ACFIJ5_02510 [Haloimpatiens sp. FM7330]|uniref:hypothetical protein n=1 Tax=Haloimpatiens sp. FM7330 TaxID=3298610 RepID=UPI0036323D5E
MNCFIQDLKICFKMSLKIFLGTFVVGIIIGAIISAIYKSFGGAEIIRWGARIGVYASCFGLFISAISFSKKSLMRPLDYYEDEWKIYFTKLNLAQVIFFISLFCLICSAVIDVIVFYIK